MSYLSPRSQLQLPVSQNRPVQLVPWFVDRYIDPFTGQSVSMVEIHQMSCYATGLQAMFSMVQSLYSRPKSVMRFKEWTQLCATCVMPGGGYSSMIWVGMWRWDLKSRPIFIPNFAGKWDPFLYHSHQVLANFTNNFKLFFKNVKLF